MTKQFLTSLCAIGLLLCLSEGRATAASLAACGDIDVEMNAECDVMAEGGCSVSDCTPVKCSASLYAQCKGECSVPEVDCEASCQGNCEADCTAKGGSIDCKANCTGRCDADCSGECTAQCASDGNKSECEANCKGTCKASCQGECDANCEVVPPSADCKASCQGSCKGSCTVKGNLDCHMACRAEGEAACTGGCEVACSKPEAAIFCDGQYIDHGGNAAECRAALVETIKARIHTEAKYSGSAACDGSTCTAEGEASAKASCAMSPAGSNAGSWFGLGLLGVVTTGLVRRRRARKTV